MLNLHSQIVRFIPVHLGLEDEHDKETPALFPINPVRKKLGIYGEEEIKPYCLPFFRTVRKNN